MSIIQLSLDEVNMIMYLVARIKGKKVLSLLLLGLETSLTVEDLNVEHGSALHDGLAGLGRHGVLDLSSVLAVVHEEDVDIL